MDGFHFYRRGRGARGSPIFSRSPWRMAQIPASPPCLASRAAPHPFPAAPAPAGGSWTGCPTQRWRTRGGVQSGPLMRGRITRAWHKSRRQVRQGGDECTRRCFAPVPVAAAAVLFVPCVPRNSRMPCFHAPPAPPSHPCPSLRPSPPCAGEGEAPSFDHGVGDPVPGDIRVGRHHRVVLSEGNYLLLVGGRWHTLGCRGREGLASREAEDAAARGSSALHAACLLQAVGWPSSTPAGSKLCACLLVLSCCCRRLRSPGGSCKSCLMR